MLGAAGGIGQPMALLLKQSTSVGHLALYDIVGTPGVAADLGHIETQSLVRYFIAGPHLDSHCWQMN